MRIVQLTDLHVDATETHPGGVDTWGNLRWALDQAAAIAPDLIVVSGDICLHAGNQETYQRVAREFAAMPLDVLFLPGNHDDRSLFHAAFGRRYRIDRNSGASHGPSGHGRLDRSVEIDGTPMLLIDSSAGELSPAQLAWLDALLDSQGRAARRGSATPLLPVWIHHPVLTGFHAFMDASYPLSNADAVRDVLLRHSADLRIALFCGHYHCEDSRSLGTLSQWTSPSLYRQLDATSTEPSITDSGPGFRIVSLGDDGDVETAVVYRR